MALAIKNSLLFAARESVEAPIDQVLASDPLNGSEDDGPVHLIVAVKGPLVWRAPDHHHLEDREVEFDRRFLGDDGDTARHVLGPHGQQVGAVEEHLSPRWSVDPVDGL